ncbi:MAG TPA: hypothetical protein VMV49_10635 [Candidatus Deferrimicrobium sp.]|nr:hypothetical protein [Candidatus Deferrimicrobium sp.]
MSKEGKKTDNEEKKARIWKIRDLIQDLEDVKDKIITFLTQDAEIDSSTQNIWGTDVKEVYYNIVAAWEMLDAAAGGEIKYAESSEGFLATAKSRFAQCSSELKVFGDEGLQLDSELTNTFEKCCTALNIELKPLIAQKELTPPSKRIIKVSETEYKLPCSVCGEIAVSFWTGIPQFSDKESLICSGIVHRAGIALSAAKQIFSWLDHDQIAEVHSYLEKNTVVFEEGIDAYCPECDKIYCYSHYDTREEWDEGFYDCTYGTCPKGHTRIIHD